MRNEPRGVGVYTALSVLAVMIIGGIISVRSSDTVVSNELRQNTQQASPVEALPLQHTREEDTDVATSTIAAE
jgi:hypothetical protein